MWSVSLPGVEYTMTGRFPTMATPTTRADVSWVEAHGIEASGTSDAARRSAEIPAMSWSTVSNEPSWGDPAESADAAGAIAAADLVSLGAAGASPAVPYWFALWVAPDPALESAPGSAEADRDAAFPEAGASTLLWVAPDATVASLELDELAITALTPATTSTIAAAAGNHRRRAARWGL